MKKTVEWLKTVIIILLSAAAIFIAPRVQPLKSLLSNINIGGIQSRLNISGELNYSSAAVNTDMSAPICMAFTSARGRVGLQYSSEVYRYYESVSTAVSEAFGSADDFESIDEAEWRSAVKAAGLYLEYGGSIPVELLAPWLGIEAPSEIATISVKRVVLGENDGLADIYIMTGDDEFLKADTAVRFTSISGAFIALEGNGAFFAFEDEAYSGLAPYTLVLNKEYSIQNMQPGVYSSTELLFKALNFNEDKTSSYTESDGTSVYVGSDCTARISPDGDFTYKIFAQGVGPSIPENDALTVANYAVAIAENAGVISAEIRPYLQSVQQENGEITVTFGCSVAGIPVYYDDRDNFMTITAADGMITSFEMSTLSFAPTDEVTYIMPEKFAQAAVEEGSSLSIVYLVDGSPTWITR